MAQSNYVEERKRLSEGIYVSGAPPYMQIELDMPELLKHLELPDTPDNRTMLLQLGESACLAVGLGVTELVAEANHKHHCHGSIWLHPGRREDCKLPRKAFCPRCSS